MRPGSTESCGCFHRERQRAPPKLGQRHSRGRIAEYGTCVNSRTRCNNPKLKHYKSYGARGIKVCAEWDCEGGFMTFLADMGHKPTPDQTIDRIDPNGDYTKKNCRWIPKAEQARNTTRNRKFTHGD